LPLEALSIKLICFLSFHNYFQFCFGSITPDFLINTNDFRYYLVWPNAMCELRVEFTLFCNLQSRARTHAVLVIGLYELLDNPTT
jgi:hypothetical protein